MKLNIIIQARCSSSRLPYKSMMPVKGIPLIVLIAKRLKRKNFNIIVATSSHHTDDDLCKLLDINKIKYFRGSLNNVYERIYDCLYTLNNNDLTLRLTGDNPFIDFRIIDKIVKELILKKKSYNYIDHSQSNVPYGISVEVFSQQFFKKLNPKNDYEKEHVTIGPRYHKNNKYKSDLVFFNEKYSDLSCSIDNLDDYLLVNYIFKKVQNPIKISWNELCRKLKKLKKLKNNNIYLPYKKKIILGTAQLGGKYGVNNFYKINKKKLENLKERKKIINYASMLGINKIDTARKYENSERIIGIGNNLKNRKIEVHTKISSIGSSKKSLFTSIKKSIRESIKYLKKNKIKYLYFHNHQNLTDLNKKDLILIKKISSCKDLGVSIYNSNELTNLITNRYLKVIQIPFNILDSRFKNFFKILKNNNKIIIARSVFIQGLIFSSIWPTKIEKYKKSIIDKISFFISKFKRVNSTDLCLAYINYHREIDGLIIGIDNKSQLFQIYSFLENKPLNHNQVQEIDKYFKKIPEIVYDPRRWGI